MSERKIIYLDDAIEAITQYLGRINRDFDNWKGTARIILDHVPSAQSEITEDDVKEYCRKRCLIVVTSDFYDEMTRRWASVQPDPNALEQEYLKGWEDGRKNLLEYISRLLSLPSVQPDWNELTVICDNCGHAIHVKRITNER